MDVLLFHPLLSRLFIHGSLCSVLVFSHSLFLCPWEASPSKSMSEAEWNLSFTVDLSIDLQTQGLFLFFFFFWGLTSPSSQSAWLVLLTLVLPVLALKAETVWKSQIPAAAWDLHRWVMEQTKRGSPFLQKQTLEWLHNSVLQWFF